MNIPRETAEVWASWFRALGDPSRVLMLHLLASKKRAMTIGEIVDALDIGQSTVSHHCQVLEQTGFVVCEREGTSTKCRINMRCLEMFPTAADVVMGRAPMASDLADGCAPWLERDQEDSNPRRRATSRRIPAGRIRP
jgi:DNA-binding transcriptional ArsR family regulator